MPGNLRFGRLHFDGSDKAVASPGDGLDVKGLLRGIAQGLTEFADGGVDAIVGLNESVGRPELQFQFVAGDNLSPSFKQEQENFQRLILHADTMPLAAKFARSGIDLEYAKSLDRSGRSARSHGSRPMQVETALPGAQK